MFKGFLNIKENRFLLLGKALSDGELIKSYLNDSDKRDMKMCWSSSEILNHIQDNRRPWVYLLQGGRIKSFVLFNHINSVVEILYLETNPLFFRQGAMKELFNDMFKAYESCCFWLDVHELNRPAQNLYKSLGFKETGLRKGYYRDGGACIQLTRDQKLLSS